MPEVKTKSGRTLHFAYTDKGKKAAKKAKKKFRMTDSGKMKA